MKRDRSPSPPQPVRPAPSTPGEFIGFSPFTTLRHTSQISSSRNYTSVLPESTLGDLLIAPARLTVEDETPIARGDRSDIFLAKLKESSGISTNVVVKQLVRVDGEFSQRYALHRASIVRALKFWKGLKHPNVLKLLGYSLNSNNEIYRLILPHLINGNVRQYLAQGTAGVVQRIKFARDVAAGLEYLHIHRPPLCCSNLNPLGILIDNNLNAVLGACASFELYYDEGDPFEDHRFTSPEVLSEGSEARNTLSDVWSWGCCVYEILTGKQPFDEAPSGTGVLVSMINRKVPGRPEILLDLVPEALEPKHASTLRSLHSYLPLCWEYDPRKRLSISLLHQKAFLLSLDGISEGSQAVVATLEELSHLLIPPDRLRIIEGSELGSGNYGEVVLGVLDETSSTPRDVAVKRLKAVGIRGERIRLAKRLARELNVWAKIQHPNVVELIGYYLDDKYESPLLISTLMRNGNVLEFIKQSEPTVNQKIGLVKGITSGLACLHDFKPAICHADLKPENVLIDLHMNAVLCDFGLASFVGDTPTAPGLVTTTTLKGTPRYMSPELSLKENCVHSLESDVWAWACTVFQVLTGSIPYAKAHGDTHLCMAMIQNQLPGDINQLLPGNLEGADSESALALRFLHSVIPQCWKFKPQSRPSMGTLLSQMSNLSPEAVDGARGGEEGSLAGLSGEMALAAAQECLSEESLGYYQVPYDASYMALGGQPAGLGFFQDTYGGGDDYENWWLESPMPNGSFDGRTRREQDEESEGNDLRAQLLALVAAIDESTQARGGQVPHGNPTGVQGIRRALGAQWEGRLATVLRDLQGHENVASTTNNSEASPGTVGFWF